MSFMNSQRLISRTCVATVLCVTTLVMGISVAFCYEEQPAPGIAVEWSGRVSSATAAEFERSRGIIRSASEFKRLWSLAFPGRKLPKIDFEKNVVLSAVAQTGFVALRFERKGSELVTNVTVTSDLTSDYGVALVAAPCTGVRKVDGKPL